MIILNPIFTSESLKQASQQILAGSGHPSRSLSSSSRRELSRRVAVQLPVLKSSPSQTDQSQSEGRTLWQAFTFQLRLSYLAEPQRKLSLHSGATHRTVKTAHEYSGHEQASRFKICTAFANVLLWFSRHRRRPADYLIMSSLCPK